MLIYYLLLFIKEQGISFGLTRGNASDFSTSIENFSDKILVKKRELITLMGNREEIRIF